MIKQLLSIISSTSPVVVEPFILNESFAYLISNIEVKRQQRAQEHIIPKAYYDYFITQANAIMTGTGIVNFLGGVSQDIEVDHWQTFRPSAFSATVGGNREYFPLGSKSNPTERQAYKVSITSAASLQNGTAKRYYIQCNCKDFQKVFSQKLQANGYCLDVTGLESTDEEVSEEAKLAESQGIGICKHAYTIMMQPQYAKYLGVAEDSGAMIPKRAETPVEPGHKTPEYVPPTVPSKPAEIPVEPLLKQRAREHIKTNLTKITDTLGSAYDLTDRDLYIRYSGSKTQYKKYLFTVSQIILDKQYLKYPPANYLGKINVISYSSQKLESKFKGTVKLSPFTYNNKIYPTLDLYSLFSPLELIEIIKGLGSSVEMPKELEQELTTAKITITESIFEDLTLEGLSFNFLIENLIREYNGYSNNQKISN